ncbi:MAG TPA: hypothetical protein VNA69_19440 [Thermoanaerobaculia bacterium]|nr:hypothetical protein [Thermoanaerobaculia bacterium]
MNNTSTRLVLCALVLLAAFNAFGHAGEVHKYMGTVTALHDDGSFMLEKTDGKTIHVAVSQTTVYQHANGEAASATDLAAGKRVVVTISKDGKTATSIRFEAPRK